MKIKGDSALLLIVVISFVVIFIPLSNLFYDRGYRIALDNNRERIEAALSRFESSKPCTDDINDKECTMLSAVDYLTASRSEKELDIQQQTERLTFYSTISSVASALLLLATVVIAALANRLSMTAVAETTRFGIAQTRAYLMPVRVEIMTKTGNNHIRFCLTLENTGNSPTTNIHVVATIHLIIDGILFEESASYPFPNIGNKKEHRKENFFPVLTSRAAELSKITNTTSVSGWAHVIISYQGIFNECPPEKLNAHFTFYGDVTDSILRAAPDYDDRSSIFRINTSSPNE